MKFKFLLVMSILLFTICSCTKDDDNPVDGSGAPTIERKESAAFTLNGATTTFDDVNAQYNENPQYLELSANSNGNTIGFECSPIPAAGTYTSSQTIGLALSIGDDFWFCNDGCTVVVNEYNADLRWFDVSVSGEVTDLFSTTSATLNSARIKVFY